MPQLAGNLVLERCPHCSVANPNLSRQHHLETTDHNSENKRTWSIYSCGRCGGIVSAWASTHGKRVQEYFPSSKFISDDIPERPRIYLQQALESIHAPAGAVMLAASAVDAMLKLKNYTNGSLYTRIEKAVEDNLITQDMAQWAHEVRLDANDQRHADEAVNIPTTDDAKRAVDFSTALAEILFALPSRVERGLNETQESN